MKKLFLILMLFVCSSVFAKKTEVSIVGDAFYINGRPTYEGRIWNGNKIEGLLMNSRMVQGVFDDLNDQTRDNYKYPDTGVWDADRNTNEFVAAMKSWRDSGVIAFTVNLQGGSPTGYGGNVCLNSAFEKDGTFRSDYQARLKRILDQANKLEMVVILGCFYFGQDQYLTDEAAVINAVDQVTEWVLKKGYRNVMIEIANECDIRYDHEILQPENIHKLIQRVQSKTLKGRRLLASTSMSGCKLPTEKIVEYSDFVLLHGNGASTSDKISTLIKDTRGLKTYSLKPVIINEDDHYDFDKENSNLNVAVGEYVSWGYFDFRRKGDSLQEGFQSVPVDWQISTDRKREFFDKIKEITGY